MKENTLTLSNGVTIPQPALGTWCIDDGKVSEVVKNAVRLGYRHIDTAQAYANESGVGKGIRECGVARSELFVTSKVAAEWKTYDEAARSIDETLSKMQMEYLDMMIIHSPQPWKEVNRSANRYLKENRAVWRALEDALSAGKLRAIGVSNFLQSDIENILAACRVKPMVNQILCHISNTPLELIQFCRSHGIAVEAYSPVAHGEALKNPVINETAKKYGVSAALLCIRYTIQLGLISIPKASSENHLKENIDVDFEISADDMEMLQHIEKIKDYGEFGFFPVFGGKM
ncbi:aldo/keto reductase [Treponema pedis]|uniref:aldo/keto reductase n=1 Tax=Treponema pedis TaxID=409322 RepID=UPI000403E9B2|nr:aldo/keto reductase [Treponema pedis]